jgi:uncharacterized protein (DUF2147 family)
VNHIRVQVVGVVAAALLLGSLAFGQTNPAVGLWKNVEPSKTVLIRTYEENGKLMGRVEKLIKDGVEDAEARCLKCAGDQKDKPIKGLLIIWDLQKEGDRWTGGKIMEPDTGKVYNCRIEPIEGGKKLNVRGSISFLGKTQTWTREE